MRGDSICAFCSRMKRGVLYSCCRAKGFNKLVLGQHLDDFAESFFMSAFRNGQVCAHQVCMIAVQQASSACSVS